MKSLLGHWLSFILLGAAALRASEGPATPAASAAPADSAPAASSATPAKAPEGIPSIFTCGDSTVRNNGQALGWGTAIEAFIDPAKATVKNVAHGGTSSLTYFNGDWPAVLPQIKPGDYVLLVFGINDGGLATPPGLDDDLHTRTDPRTKQESQAHTYGWYMSTMASDALAKGAHVVLLTVTARNIWTNPKATFKDADIVAQADDYDPAEDKIDHKNWGKYPEWTKAVGAKLHVPVVDLTNIETLALEKMGREAAKTNYLDHNHTTPAGAEVVAKAVVSGLRALKNSPFNALLSAKGKMVELADPKYVANNLADDHPPVIAKPGDVKPAAAK